MKAINKIKYLIICGLLYTVNVRAQGNGIGAGSSPIADYIPSVANLMIVIGAIVFSFGAIKVYIRWNSGMGQGEEIFDKVTGLLGGAMFLLISGILVRVFWNV